MEVESTQVHVGSDGKKLIDVTLRRPGLPPPQAPLVVPHFDDDDDSSSDSDLDEAAYKSVPTSTSKNHYSSGSVSTNNDKDDHIEDESADDDVIPGQAHDAFQPQVQWDHVQELQELTNANATLNFENRDLRQQIKALQIQLEAQTPVPGLDVDAMQDILLEKDNIEHDVRDVKIVHQAKTLRKLKRALQREKQLAVGATKQCKVLEADNQKLEQEVDTLQLKLQRFQARAAAAVAEKSNTDISTHGDGQNQESLTPPGDNSQYSGTFRKMCEELKSKNVALQQELKKTQRALVREVGDDVPLEVVVGNTDNTSSGSSRRGRAQHIIMLRAKVKRLQAQLVSGTSSPPATNSEEPAAFDVDQRAQQDLSSQQMQRQKLVDQLTSQRDELQERLHRLTRKYDALKARAQILDREKQDTRNKFQVLVEKSHTDDALVDVLQRQLETWKAKLHEARRARTADGGAKSTANHEERVELERLRNIVAAHKGEGNGRTANLSTPSGGVMPQLSEITQFRAIAAEKERLTEVIRSLKTKLEDKDKQLRIMSEQQDTTKSAPENSTQMVSSLPPIENESISRIPRRPGSKIPLPGGRTATTSSPTTSKGPPAPSAVMMEQQQQQLKHEMETLRRTFRESMREKDEHIAELEQQQRAAAQSTNVTPNNNADAMIQELLDLQEENAFLRQEFDKLRTRYEAFVKQSGNDTKKCIK